MTDTAKLLDALNNAAHDSIVAVRSRTQATGIVTTCRYEGTAAVRAVLAELDRRGWVVVPKHPTNKMQGACCVLADDDGEWLPETHQNEFWKMMVAAAPKLGEKGR